MSTSADTSSSPVLKRDRDGIPLDDPRLKGIARYLNNSTIRGRANAAKATVVAFAGVYVYYSFISDPKVKKSGQTTVIVDAIPPHKWSKMILPSMVERKQREFAVNCWPTRKIELWFWIKNSIRSQFHVDSSIFLSLYCCCSSYVVQSQSFSLSPRANCSLNSLCANGEKMLLFTGRKCRWNWWKKHCETKLNLLLFNHRLLSS